MIEGLNEKYKDRDIICGLIGDDYFFVETNFKVGNNMGIEHKLPAEDKLEYMEKLIEGFLETIKTRKKR